MMIERPALGPAPGLGLRARGFRAGLAAGCPTGAGTAASGFALRRSGGFAAGTFRTGAVFAGVSAFFGARALGTEGFGVGVGRFFSGTVTDLTL
jgi:hypothetical protein